MPHIVWFAGRKYLVTTATVTTPTGAPLIFESHEARRRFERAVRQAARPLLADPRLDLGVRP